MSLLLTNVGRLYTATERGVLTHAALLVEGGHVAWIGSAHDRRSIDPEDVVDVGGALVTPGLIDAHTHPVYAGDRLAEITLRSTGASYEDVAAAGGGIRTTVEATRHAPGERLTQLVRQRLQAWLTGGTTTIEAKTGYHLDHDGEIAAVEILAAADRARHRRLPRIEVTFLAAHSTDLGITFDRQAQAAAAWCAEAAQAGARFVDVFCDVGYFDLAQARRVLLAGQESGLLARIHADELGRIGGALLAAEIGAVSADHLLRATDEDAKALAASRVVATLCPVTAMALHGTPPARTFLDHGVTLALGTDHNPGQSGTTSMSLVVGLAVHLLGLSVDEALTAATAGGAASLRTPDRGALRPGMVADLVVWDADHEGAFAWSLGLNPRQVYLAGDLVGP